MWLVPRDTRGRLYRTGVPAVVCEAIVRWYTGGGSDADHRASVTAIVKARDHHQWIACDCLGGEADPPLLSPAYLSEAETYYLRRLTSEAQARPEHDLDCPFFREQAPERARANATETPRVIDEPDGLFSAHRLAPEKLSQAPDDSEPDDRARGVAIPRLARLMWQLMAMAGVNTVAPLDRDQGRDASMAREFAALRAAAERLEIAPGVPLAKHLYTHIDPYDRDIVFARLRAAQRTWPSGHAPQAFLLLYAQGISGATITLAQGRELRIKNRIQHTGIHQRGVGAPYLVLAVVGEHNPRDGYAALRAYAQPIARPANFVAVHNEGERLAVRDLLDLQYRLRRSGIALGFTRPLFDLMSRIGPVRPDLIVDIRDGRTGEIVDTALEIIPREDPDYIRVKRRQIENLRELGRVVSVSEDHLKTSGLETILLGELGIALN